MILVIDYLVFINSVTMTTSLTSETFSSLRFNFYIKYECVVVNEYKITLNFKFIRFPLVTNRCQYVEIS